LLANPHAVLRLSQIFLVQAPSVKDRFLAVRARPQDQSRTSATGRISLFAEPSGNALPSALLSSAAQSSDDHTNLRKSALGMKSAASFLR
jgi:hypothetical protein